MAALHIKTLQFHLSDSRIFADLQLDSDDHGVGVRVRITKTPRNGKERYIGTAGLNIGGELVRIPEGLTEHERDMIEKDIRERLNTTGKLLKKAK